LHSPAGGTGKRSLPVEAPLDVASEAGPINTDDWITPAIGTQQLFSI
jgi:hypothetical protein